MDKILHKFIGVLLATAFAFTILFFLNTGMDMYKNADTSGCVFDQSVTCLTNHQEHINYWQSIFTPTQPISKNLSILLIIGAAALFRNNYFKTKRLFLKIHRRRNIITKLFNYILQALSDGILNPKIYNLS